MECGIINFRSGTSSHFIITWFCVICQVKNDYFFKKNQEFNLDFYFNKFDYNC